MTQTKVMAINFPFPCSWGVNMRFAPIADSLSVDVPESSPTGLASWHSRESVFDQLKLSTSTFLRSLRSMPITALLRSYGRSDSCPLGSSALSSMNTVSSSRQVSLIHVSGLPIPPSPPTGQTPMQLFHATPQLIEFPASAGLGFTFVSQARRSVSAVSSSLSYGWIARFRLLFTSPRGDAITFSYRPESVYLKRTFTSRVKHAFRRTIPAFAGMTTLKEALTLWVKNASTRSPA